MDTLLVTGAAVGTEADFEDDRTAHCLLCGASEKPGSRFCSMCGKPMPMPSQFPAESCGCGCSEFTDDTCVSCGARRKSVRDQPSVLDIGPGLAGATDPGRNPRHPRNDDAFILHGPASGGPGSIVIVCDGVSQSQHPDIASLEAVKAAMSCLRAMAVGGAQVGQLTVDECRASMSNAMSSAMSSAMSNAICRAHDAVCHVPFDRTSSVDPPATTLVAAVVLAGARQGYVNVTVGWLGDSRLYWLPRTGDRQGMLLTRDHSWCNEAIDKGLLSEDEARGHPKSHAITKSLGTEDFTKSTPCPQPSVECVELPADGWLLACTDGLWGYAESPSALRLAGNGHLGRLGAADISRHFVDFANARGGRDNITCAVVELG